MPATSRSSLPAAPSRPRRPTIPGRRTYAAFGLIATLAACGAHPFGTREDPADSDASNHRSSAAPPKPVTHRQLVDRHQLPDAPELGYKPGHAARLKLIRKRLKLHSTTARAVSPLDAHGFAIYPGASYASWAHGYEDFYRKDLPLYISADSILHAVHRSFSGILSTIERESLVAMLDELLAGLVERLPQLAREQPQAAHDLDLLLSTALATLRGEANEAKLSTSDPEAFAVLGRGIASMKGSADIQLFGHRRTIDFSQFKPRGHYANESALRRYFKAMSLLGRIDLRMIDYQPQGEPMVQRRQLAALLALDELFTPQLRSRWQTIDRTIEAFAGQSDNLTLPEVEGLRQRISGAAKRQERALSDEALRSLILADQYGHQAIQGHIMVSSMVGEARPLPASFALFGPRYTSDSHVLSEVVHDRVRRRRMMPSSLDLSFAALGNDTALPLLAPELERYDYAQQLHNQRHLHDQRYAQLDEATLYDGWLAALRALSTRADHDEAGLPTTMRSEAWRRRLLNTQMASWAELRRDTILYSKQSYTMSVSCEYPAAYVEPYPEFYRRLGQYMDRGRTLAAELAYIAPHKREAIDDYFRRSAEILKTLEAMAQRQRAGQPHTKAQLAFVNRAVRREYGPVGCTEALIGVEGWYPQLFYRPLDSASLEPSIADIHTQTTDEKGQEVGRILHAATGRPRVIVVTIKTDWGPQAFVGLASAYHEVITERFERLDDQSWQERLHVGQANDPAWLTDLLQR